MSKKNIFLIALIPLLAGLSLYLNRGRFQSDPIRIGSRSIDPRGAMLRQAKNSKTKSVIFLLNRELQLTSIKVIPVSCLETNKYPLPLWQLVSDSNSIPVKDFAYGANIRGMRPGVKGASAETLQPGVNYRILLEAGGLKAEHDFTPVPRTR
jgi:hypothetical protein